MPERLERELDFDISAGLRSLDDLDERLTTIVETFGGGLSAAIDDAISSAASVDIEVAAPDVSAVEDAVSGAVTEGAAVEPVVTVEADASAVGTEISDSVDSADTSIDIDADASAVLPEIQAQIDAVDPNLEIEAVVDVSADTDSAQAAIDELESTAVTVSVDADTSGAVDEVDNLTNSAEAGSSAMGGLGVSTQAFGAAAGAALGDTSGLGSAVGGMSTSAAGAVGVVGALAVVTGKMFTNAADAERATLAFNNALGDQADAVSDIDVGGLAGDLSDLAIAAGTSDEALQIAAARIANLGNSSGASRVAVGQTTEQILALALALSTANPSLGEAGQVAEGLTNALARGGRALANYRISLTTAEIAARALSDTGKSSAADLTIYEKAAAGAALATEQFGDSLGVEFQQSLQTGEIQARSLKVRLDELLEALGTPLIAPVVEVMTEATPIAEALARILALLAESVLPALPPLLGAIATPLEIVADIMEAIPAPVLSGATAFVALTVAMRALLGLLPASAAGLAGVAGPVAGIVVAVGTVIAVVKSLQSANADAQRDQESFRQSLFGTASNLDDLNAALAEFDKRITDAFGDISQKGVEAGQFGEVLADVGVTATTAARAIEFSDDEFENFTGTLTDTQVAGDTLVLGFQDIIGELEKLRTKTQDAAHASLELAVNTDQISDTQRDAAIAANTAADGTINYVGALQDSTAAAEEVVRQQEAVNVANLESAGSWDSLRREVLLGSVTMADAAQIAEDLGVSQDEVTTRIQAAQQEITTFVDNSIAKLPTASDAFNTWQANIKTAFQNVVDKAKDGGQPFTEAMDAYVQAADPQKLIDQLNLQLLGIAAFQTNLEILVSQGLTEVADLLSQQGPQLGGTLAQQLVDEPANAHELEKVLEHYKAMGIDVETGLREDVAPRVKASATHVGAQGKEGFVSGFNIVEHARAAVDAVGPAIRDALAPDSPAAAIASAAGRVVGDAIGAGLIAGIRARVNAAAAEAAAVARAAAAAMRAAAGVHSPSQVTFIIGQQIADGLVLGMHAGTNAVIAASSDLAIAAIPNVALPSGSMHVAGSSSNVSTVQVLDIDVNLTVGGNISAGDAASIGQQVGAGVQRELVKRGVIAQVRAG